MVHSVATIPSTASGTEVAFLAEALGAIDGQPFSSIYAEVEALARREGGAAIERAELLAAVAEAKRCGQFPPACRALLFHLASDSLDTRAGLPS